ncbi:uncharacterized protein E5676_scaffold19523G00190 [Cucumis melo var. makuwa]|uniref:Retrotransposon gag domain-containing protein n=1 Tax=Cucumis melo var. makuwa TaxID=1194695 RepID=A0A5A7UVZ2_CUCMM|nr:uncharacterized protein E6C27_scaffold409G00200 [Cucumis melo var. makuwa]TYK22483.1 uncharacterized protein E5676_scaffold19523G00190 [Cucumis melo var. makuwa]
MLEKCFDVMNCLEKRKVRLATFLLQKKVEGWWKSILARRSDARTLDWQNFRGIFEDKYYPNTYCEAKRHEFLGAEEEKSTVELSRRTSTASGFRGSEQRRFTPGCGQSGDFKKDCSQLNMTIQRDQGVGSQTVEQSRVSVVPTEGTSGARQKGVVEDLSNREMSML